MPAPFTLKKLEKTMKPNIITMKSFAKINLSLDVLGKLPDGYHEVEMVLHQIELYDDVSIRLIPDEKGIEVSTNRKYLPRDQRNIAYQAADLMREVGGIREKIRIDIKKRIPVTAGLGGGSGNAASVLLGLNHLLGMKMSLEQLMTHGEKLGSDVVFSLMGQAASHDFLGDEIRRDPKAGICALAKGRGTQLSPLQGIKAYVVLTKPPVGCSTPEIYKLFDEEIVETRPNNQELIDGLRKKNWDLISKNMVNVLENVVFKRYAIAMYTKSKVISLGGAQGILMSGSGPTIYGLYLEEEEARKTYKIMKNELRETFLTQTSVLGYSI
jgi:4-diphosphocytidyl-2-C-methyl-D-erythritol kinase